jgi:hypothetical protein
MTCSKSIAAACVREAALAGTFVACMALPPAWADSAFDEALRKAEDCSNDKAVKYSRGTTEPAQTIAEAALDACESLWGAVQPFNESWVPSR